MKQVLIIGYVWVEPTSSAAGSRMLQLIETFVKHNYKVSFASPAQKGEKAINLNEFNPLINEINIVLNSSSFDSFVRELSPDIVLFDRFMMEEQFGWRVAENCPDALRILDTEDLHFLRKTRHQQFKRGDKFTNEALLQSNDAKREIASILRCDLSLIISTYEMKLLKNVFKIDERLLIHLPFLLKKIEKAQVNKWMSFKDRNHFVFIGNFFHAPNVSAVLELKKNIWSSIREQLPKAELHVYGAYATPQIQQLHKPKEGFIIKGYVENAEEVIQKSKVLLAPILFGAGIKGKLTEAMLCGTPSVTTSIGAEGMRRNLPWNGYVENDFEKFVEGAIELYTNEIVWNESQQKGIEIINNFYDSNILEIKLLNEIKKIKENLKEHRQQNFLGSLLQHQTLQATKYMSKWIELKNSI